MTRLLPNRLTAQGIRGFVERHHDGDVQSFLDRLSDGMNQIMRTDLAEAAHLAQRVRTIIPVFSGLERAMLLRICARYHHLSGAALEAVAFYRRADRIYRQKGDSVSSARIGRALTDVLIYLGRYDAAERSARRAARIFRRRKMRLDWAQTAANLGNVYHRCDDNHRALREYDKAYEVFRRSDVKSAVALIQFNRGNILTNLCRLDEADACYREADGLYRGLGMTLAAVQAKYSLAYLEFLRGHFAEALQRFREVLTAFKKLGDQRGRAQTELDVIEIQLHLNLHDVVDAEAVRVAGYFRKLNMRYEEAKCWYFAACARAASELILPARRAVAKARELLHTERNAAWHGSLNLLEARILELGGRHDQARQKAVTAVRALKRAGDVRRETNAQIFLAELDLLAGKHTQCYRRLQPFLDREIPLPAHVAFDAWWLEGKRRRAVDDIEGAIAAYEKAIEQNHMMAGSVPADETRLFFLSDKMPLYGELAGLLIWQGRHADALRVHEQGRHFRRARNWSAARGTEGESSRGEDRRRIEALRSQLNSLYRFPVSLDRFGSTDLEKVRKIENELWQRARRGRMIDRWAPASTDRHTGLSFRKLPSHRAVIVLATVDGSPSLFVVRRTGISYRRIARTWDMLSPRISRFYFFIEKNRLPSDFQNRFEREIIAGTEAELSELASTLFWPLLRELQGITELVFVPSGQFGAIPFHALSLPDGRTIADVFRVSHTVDLPTALKRESARVPSDAVGEVFSPGRSETTEMDAEATIVSRRFPKSRRYTGEGSVREGLLAALQSEADFLHVATHATAALDNPLFSQILLNDGPLYAFDLAGIHVRKSLVTLSACQTGRPGVLPTGEVYGLAEAFLSQGAKCVLSSLWTVDDRTARAFMTAFYSALQKGRGLTDAWREAVVRVRRKTHNPYHWAPFVLIGSSD